jgi:hypothetical protein
MILVHLLSPFSVSTIPLWISTSAIFFHAAQPGCSGGVLITIKSNPPPCSAQHEWIIFQVHISQNFHVYLSFSRCSRSVKTLICMCLSPDHFFCWRRAESLFSWLQSPSTFARVRERARLGFILYNSLSTALESARGKIHPRRYSVECDLKYCDIFHVAARLLLMPKVEMRAARNLHFAHEKVCARIIVISFS